MLLTFKVLFMCFFSGFTIILVQHVVVSMFSIVFQKFPEGSYRFYFIFWLLAVYVQTPSPLLARMTPQISFNICLVWHRVLIAFPL